MAEAVAGLLDRPLNVLPKTVLQLKWTKKQRKRALAKCAQVHKFDPNQPCRSRCLKNYRRSINTRSFDFNSICGSDTSARC